MRSNSSKGSLRFRLRPLLLPMALWYTRSVYRKLARATAVQVHDYQRSGFRVPGVIGVDGSPTCGVRKTLDIKFVTDGLARLDLIAEIEGRPASANAMTLLDQDS